MAARALKARGMLKTSEPTRLTSMTRLPLSDKKGGKMHRVYTILPAIFHDNGDV
jgi:hypothetical protein